MHLRVALLAIVSISMSEGKGLSGRKSHRVASKRLSEARSQSPEFRKQTTPSQDLDDSKGSSIMPARHVQLSLLFGSRLVQSIMRMAMGPLLVTRTGGLCSLPLPFHRTGLPSGVNLRRPRVHGDEQRAAPLRLLPRLPDLTGGGRRAGRSNRSESGGAPRHGLGRAPDRWGRFLNLGDSALAGSSSSRSLARPSVPNLHRFSCQVMVADTLN